jgi:hypothetical protein
MKQLVFTLILTLVCFAAIAQQQFCFNMQIGKTSKRVLFNFVDEDWKKGTIQYVGQASAIPIRQKSLKTLRRNPGRPDYTRYDFEELVDGKVTGIYSFSLQGANFYDAYYQRLRDRKKFIMKRPEIADEDCFSNP